MVVCKELEVMVVSRGRLRVKGYFQRTPACLCFMFALFFSKYFFSRGARQKGNLRFRLFKRNCKVSITANTFLKKAGFRVRVGGGGVFGLLSFKGPLYQIFPGAGLTACFVCIPLSGGLP